MKERYFFNDDFEDQLREKADQFKMYPSDKVWNEVYGSLHTKKRRFVAGMSVLISAILILAGKQLLSPSKITEHPAVAMKTSPPPAPVNLQDFTAPSESPGHLIASVARTHKLNAPFALEENVENSGDVPVYAGVTAVENNSKELPKKIGFAGSVSGADQARIIASSNESDPAKASPVLLKANENYFPLNTASSVASSVDASLQQTHGRGDRLSWQVYVTPNLSYRKLSGVDYSRLSAMGSPITLVQFTNVNTFVDRTPALGFEVGGALVYRLTRNISVKAGLQFNYGRYYINAYHSDPSQSSPTLNSYFGYVADSLAAPSLSAFANRKDQQQLQNQYYELSVPVGLEMKIAGSGRLQLHVAGTIQPSYLLNKDSYVLSTDYDHYSKESSAFRRWNLDGSGEIFVSYRIGSFRWQIGPQLRYQILSTYKSSYPIKENMMQYGIKIGFTKTIW
jgi:Outer membrane protein beta-barrel domain